MKRVASGFTIIELLIVVVVIAILASITLVSYNGIQQSAKTSRSATTAEQVRKKAELWNATYSVYPDLAQLRTNSLAPTNLDTPGGAAGPIEAKLTSPSLVMGASITEERSAEGFTVFYEPCNVGGKLLGAHVAYWDFSKNQGVDTVIGTCS